VKVFKKSNGHMRQQSVSIMKGAIKHLMIQMLWNKHAQLSQQNDTTECVTDILSPAGAIILLATISRPALWHMQPLIHWVPGPHSTGVKLPESETDHSPPAGA
jgi:hypothetical protein